MTSSLIAVVFAASLCSASDIQDSDQYTGCISKAATQTAMHVCASEEASRVDAKLNEIYQKLLAAAKNQSGAVEKIRGAERAWIAFRDAYVDAMYPAKDKQAAYGSVYPMQVNLLRATLTRQQIDALNALLQQYSAAPRE